ncbi:MAG: penicillin-binding transpeptidase domain-containing protein, partial [Myxococcota bacterium]
RMLREADLPGIYLTPEPRRFYPGMTLAGPVLGFAGIDGGGLDGIEYKMDELLSGRQARFAAVRDAAGRVMMADGLVKPEPGATILLTIDRAIQFAAERALQDAIVANSAKAGSVVVLDVSSGGVLAMANWPTYDPNRPGARGNARNRAVTDAFEIGSVMKVFTVAAALDTDAIDTDELIDVEEGRLQIGRKLIRDTYRDGELTVGGIIKRSSNVGAVKVARRLGKKGLHEAMIRYGFASPTGIELPGERSGRIRNPKQWGEIGLASISFGYGMTATAVQIAAGFAALGNGGEYLEPRLIHEVRDASGKILYTHTPLGRAIVKPATAAAMLPMLASVFDRGRDGGTARTLERPGFPVGGKTGTARKVDPETRQYSQELYVSSFAGLAPIDDPRIAVVVIIDEPRGEHYYGGRVAGPAFVQVVDETLRYLGVPPQSEPPGHATGHAADAGRPSEPAQASPPPPPAITPLAGADSSGSQPAEADADQADIPAGGVPNFIGMGVTRALEQARRSGLAVAIEGSGVAVEQYPPAGSEIGDDPCLIVFSQHRQTRDPR